MSVKTVFAVGDVHGHLQLALCVAAAEQMSRSAPFDAVLLCGDLGSFTNEDELDAPTRRFARDNSLELEFLRQWSIRPEPAWLRAIFVPVEEGGLGLMCPVLFVRGNHEGFAQLRSHIAAPIPDEPVDVTDLPTVDAGGRILYLPSGWAAQIRSGLVVAAVGGVDPAIVKQRLASEAYIQPRAVEAVCSMGASVDILMSHQGPAATQGLAGSPLLDPLAASGVARAWTHGHDVKRPVCSPRRT